MKLEGFERISDDEFEEIEEWAKPESKPDLSFCYKYFPNLAPFLDSILHENRSRKQIVTPYEPTTSYEQAKVMDVDQDLRDIDISKELRLLGYPESEINRWALIKKIEQRTGKQCDDYL